MAGFSHVITFSGEALPFAAGIRDLVIRPEGDIARLLAGNGQSGGMMSFALSANAPALFSGQQAYGPGQFPLATTTLFMLEQGATSWIIPLGRQDTSLDGYALSGAGFGAPTQFSAGYGSMDAAVALAVGGQQMVYASLAGSGGLTRFTVAANGSLTAAGSIADTAQTYTGDSVALATVSAGGLNYVISASSAEHGITAHVVKPGGQLVAVASIGAREGLGIANPSALETVSTGGQEYLVLASAGTSSLSVIQVQDDGGLLLTDHVLDGLDTRFQAVSVLETVEIGARAYVIAGGADDGLSLFTLLPGGRLLQLASIADSTTTTLANVSALAATVLDGVIQIFAASESEPGLTQFSFDPGPAGLVLEGSDGMNTLSGQSANDVLSGAGGDDTLSGGGGDDILMDGHGSDTLIGGAGADVFVLCRDGQTDYIQDFELGSDRLDLSALPMLHDISQLSFQSTAQGVRISYRSEVVEIISASGQPLSAGDFTNADLLGLSRPATGSVSYMQVLQGGDSNDQLSGQNGDDTIWGAAGADRLVGGGGNDTLQGDAGNDVLFGQWGFDTLHGGDGNDVLHGGAQADNLYGELGDDTLNGDLGNDGLFGGAGNDTLNGGA
ncbi:MAG TPA: hypothetical protein ENK45_01890, partial [Aliiroseovarius sp.]|nr:hypothetical protein [Aliiroseovarius sp.]